MLYTSIDIIIIFSYNKELYDKLILLKNFKTDDSKNNTSFFENLILFLLFKIPDTEAMKYFESRQEYINLNNIIGKHYKDYFRYNISSISKRFSTFIGVD